MEQEYPLTRFARLRVRAGQQIDPGIQLTEGPLDPKEVLDVQGVRAAQQYLVDQVQEVYRSQGVDIHDKHIEMIVRQMLRRVRVVNPGDSSYLPAELVDDRDFLETNRALVKEGKHPAEGRPELMGITKASLATDSWLSAASFQETTRVLTEAALQGRSDFLRGLKENVIIGKLIPAGTGADPYQAVQPLLPGRHGDQRREPVRWAAFGPVRRGGAARQPGGVAGLARRARREAEEAAEEAAGAGSAAGPRRGRGGRGRRRLRGVRRPRSSPTGGDPRNPCFRDPAHRAAGDRRGRRSDFALVSGPRLYSAAVTQSP